MQIRMRGQNLPQRDFWCAVLLAVMLPCLLAWYLIVNGQLPAPTPDMMAVYRLVILAWLVGMWCLQAVRFLRYGRKRVSGLYLLMLTSFTVYFIGKMAHHFHWYERWEDNLFFVLAPFQFALHIIAFETYRPVKASRIA